MNGNVGIRWQEQMEDHLAHVRELTRSAKAGLDEGGHIFASIRATLATAQATAALTLAVANTGGDLELEMNKMYDELQNITHALRERNEIAS